MRSWFDYFPHWHELVSVHPVVADVLSLEPRDEAELDFARFVDAAPKTEVHVHAEAAVAPTFYAGLSGQPAGPAAPFSDFGDFLRRWMRNLGHLREAADYGRLGRAFVADRAARRIVRCECHLSPLDTSLYRARVAPGLPELALADNLAHFAAGLRDGMVAAGGQVRCAPSSIWSASLPRTICGRPTPRWRRLSIPPTTAMLTASASSSPLASAVPSSSPRRLLPDRPRPFRALGLRLDLHSGEQLHVSPAEHAQAVALLSPTALAYGFRSAADGFYFEGAIAACPLSNVLLRCHPDSLASHPIADMYARTLNVSINTDDPLLLGH